MKCFHCHVEFHDDPRQLAVIVCERRFMVGGPWAEKTRIRKRRRSILGPADCVALTPATSPRTSCPTFPLLCFWVMVLKCARTLIRGARINMAFEKPLDQIQEADLRAPISCASPMLSRLFLQKTARTSASAPCFWLFRDEDSLRHAHLWQTM